MWRSVWCMAIGFAACEPKLQVGTRSTPIEEPETFPEAPDTDTGEPTTEAPATVVYALYERNAETVQDPNPLNNNTAQGLTHSIKRVVWEEGSGTYQEQLCLTWGNEVFGTTWAFADGFAAQRGILERPVDIEPGVRFEAGPYLDLLGTDLETGELPTTPDEPGVVDTDKDSLPGHTIYINNNVMGDGEVYVVQRSDTTLSGTWVDSFRATGPVVADTESNTIDASTWWLNLQGPANSPDPASSYFVLLRVNPDMDCQAIYEDRESLDLMVQP